MSKRTVCWASCLFMSLLLTYLGDPKSAFIWCAAGFVIVAMGEEKP